MSGMPRAVAVTAIGAGVLLASSGAFALWSTTGLAWATPAAIRAAPITVIADGGPADLYPGFDGGDITFRLKNPNPFPMTVLSMMPADVTSDDPSACPASYLSVRPAGGLALFVAAHSTSGPLSIADVVSMAREAPDGCQGVSFTIALTVTGDQAGPPASGH